MADVAALTLIAKSALQLLSPLAKDESLLLWNSQKELKRLTKSVDTIACLLQDADKMQSTSESVQGCLSRLREAMYGAEDLFDGLAYIVLRKRTMSGNSFTKEARLCFSKSNPLLVFVKTAHEVKSLRESLDSIKRDMELGGFQQSPPPVVQQLMRVDRQNFKSHYFVHEEDVIGREEDTDRIVNMMLPKDGTKTSEGRILSVVAVTGFGGLGKTNVAQLVYNHKRVQDSFDLCLWACINYLSDLDQVLIEIVASKEKKPYKLGLVKLQEKLREIIGGRRFLIVLDDVWDENVRNWDALKTIFRCGKSGSMVLVTARSTKVAECFDALKPYYELGLLSDESAWSLFQKKAFYEGELSKHPELEQIGKQIVHKSGNVPLAIITIGSLLRHKIREVRVWSEFMENKLGEVLSSSGDRTHVSIKQVLMVSYNDLQPNLKLCFTSCSLFPKDHKFDKDELVRLWLSQGFVKPITTSKESLEKQGEDQFFELVQRCFFQEVKYEGWMHKYYTAKMHDLLHDLAIDIARAEIFVLEKLSRDKVEAHDSCRHISVNDDVGESFDYCSLASHPQNVRTLLFQKAGKLDKGSLDMLMSRFRMLRTLSLPNLGTEHVSDSIGELIHLRYLDLSGNKNLKQLPKSICKLHYLMFFVLKGCNCLKMLPQGIEKLTSLRQLYIDGCDSLSFFPPGLKALTSLVNLDRVIVHCQSGGLGYLSELDKLRGSVTIELPEEGWADAVADAKESKMSSKHKLNEMVIQWKGSSNTTDDTQKMGKDEARAVLEELEPHESLERLKIIKYGGQMFPGWVCRLKNLRELYLEGCDQVEHIVDETVQRPCLPQVSEVSIRSCLALKGQMPVMEGINSLHLETVDVQLVEELLSANPNFPSLSLLRLWNIQGLTRLSEECIRHLTALQTLDVFGGSDLRWVSGRGLAHLTALKRLSINSGEIRGEDADVDAGMPWKALKGLESVEVYTGDKHLKEGLQYLTRLANLDVGKWIRIEEDDGMIQLPLKGLQSLRSLRIGLDGKKCNLLKLGIQYLHSLRWLTISGCEELHLGWKNLFSMKLDKLSLLRVKRVMDVEDDDMITSVEQQSLLRKFTVWDGEGAKWVDHLPWTFLGPSLQELHLSKMGEREQLPDGIQHLSSLEHLSINGCKKVSSLPTWLPQISSLKRLIIEDCSEELERRCKRETGQDWPLISHISHTRISARSYPSEEKGKKGWFGGLTLSKCNPIWC